MDINAIARWLVEITASVPWLQRALLTLLTRVATFPALKLELMACEVLGMSGGCWYLHYKIKVKNRGNGVGRRCWPQLSKVTPYNGPFSAQAIAWQEDFPNTTPSPRKVTCIDIPPKDETKEFVVVYTDASNPATADVPIARQGMRVPTLVPFGPGQYIMRVTVVGDNFSCQPMSLRVTLTHAGDRTWETLRVEEWTWRKKLGKLLKLSK